MNVAELAHQNGMKLLVSPHVGRGDVARVCASNTMSDLIANAGRDTLIVTSLNNSQLVRVAELMDVPGICLVADAAPCPELSEGARATGTALLVTSLSLEEARKLLERIIASPKAARS
jgi:hypothetical protein